MFESGASAAVGRLVATDLTIADAAILADASTAVATLQAFVDHAKVQIHRRTRALAAEGDRSAEHVLIDEGRLSGSDAKSTSDRDRVCETLPPLDEALASGACTGGHLDALAKHTRDLSDDERADLTLVADDLAEHAANEPVGLFDRTAKNLVDRIRSMHRPDSDADELDRQRKRSRVKRWTERETGMKQTLISLDPVRDASLWTAIGHHLARLRAENSSGERSFDELQVDAVLATMSTTVSAGESSVRVPEVVVHVDAATLCHGRHDGTVCETLDGVEVPVSTAQRLCCEAVVQAVVVQPDGTVDQLCRELRTANRQQRRMLAAMYRTCVHPHCEVGFSQCRIHHIEWFSRGGATVLANLAPLCERHHHLVHEGGWNLTIDADRRISWHRPDGTVWHTDTGPPRTDAARARGPAPPNTDHAA